MNVSKNHHVLSQTITTRLQAGKALASGKGLGGKATDQLQIGIEAGRASLLSALSRNPSSSVLHSAAGKMDLGLDLLTASKSDGISAAATALLLEKSKQVNEDVGATVGRIRDHFKNLQIKTSQKIKKIQEKIDAEKNGNFWSKLLVVFKAIATAFSAIASVLTGGALAVVAAALMIASFVLSVADLGEVGTYLSLGLGIAAAALGAISAAVSGVSAACNTATAATQVGKLAQAVESITKFVPNIGAALGQAGAGVCGAVRGCYQGNALRAEGTLTEIKAESKKLLESTREEQELINELQEALHKAFMHILGILCVDHRAKMPLLLQGETK
ncbi:MAG: hypothetical protein V1754_11060 [Pseudomonadota bacterium]